MIRPLLLPIPLLLAVLATAQLPPPPQNVRVTNGCTSIRLDWSPVLQANDYYIRRNTVNNQNTATTVACHQPNFYVDTTVNLNVTYYYWVGSNNGISGCGNGPPGSVVSGTLLTTPAVPTAVAATTGLCGSVIVSWNTAAGATGYTVYRNTSSSSTSAIRIGSSPTSPFQDTTGDAGRLYFYWVTGDNACGSSARSSGATGSSAPVPGTAGGVSASDGTSCTSVTITWNAASNATGYEVYRNTQNSSAGRIQIGSPGASPFQDTTASRNTTYFYWVRGINTCSAGAYSAPDSGYVGSCASVQAYGGGCGVPLLLATPAAGSRPILGRSQLTDVGNVPAGVAFMALGTSRTMAGSLPLPFSLSGLGMPGCQLLQSLTLAGLPCAPIGPGTARHDLPIPGSPAIVGVEMYLQAWAPAPGQNPAGLIFSNGLVLVPGTL